MPLDHGYALFSALARALPVAHKASGWGIHPIRGRRGAAEGDSLVLDTSSYVKLRMPVGEIGAVLPLAGAAIKIGDARVSLGVPRVHPLVSSSVLRSRLVTIRGFLEEEQAFLGAVRRQLAAIPLGQDPERIVVRIGRRRVTRIRGKAIVGFALQLEELDPDASLAVQATGVGGRRHMGAGVFVPPGRLG